MGEYLLYKEIIAGKRNVQEWVEKKVWDPDPALVQDLVTLFAIENNNNKISTLFSLQEKLYENLNYSYNDFGERDYNETRHIRCKETLHNIQRKKEITLIEESEKIKVLKSFLAKDILIDKIKFIDHSGNEKLCLLTTIEVIDSEENPSLSVVSEFVANVSWDILEEKNIYPWIKIDLADIKEMVVDEIKYTFLA